MFRLSWPSATAGCLVAACVLWLAGSAPPQQRPVATVEYAEFFTDELKRLELHLDFQAVRFVLENRGDPLPLELTLEDWKDGKVTVLKTLQDVVRNKADISLSWRNIKDDNNDIRAYRLVLALRRGAFVHNGITQLGSQSTPLLWQPTKGRLMSSTNLGDVTELSKKRPVHAWMLGVHTGKAQLVVGDAVETAAKATAHALVLKIRVVD